MNNRDFYKNFTETTVFPSLQKKAESPYDLTTEKALSGRFGKYCCRTPLLDIHFATQRIDDAVLTDFQTMADELHLVEQFSAMQRGAVLNNIDGYESEERQVLHTASRDIFHKPFYEPAASARTQAELDKLQKFLNAIDTGTLQGSSGKPFTSVVHVGIGGSDLGPRALYEALVAYGLPGRSIHFIANVDPDDATRQLAEVDLASTLVVIVSKSGSTLETLTNETLVRTALEKEGLNPLEHCVAITGEGSPMDNPERYLRSFYMYDYIGGRYSATSMVGAVSLSFFVGFSRFMELLQGADEIDRLAEKKQVLENPALLLALLGIWNHNFLNAPTTAVLPYSQALHRFVAHLQQCDMESNGKSITRTGKFVDYKTGSIIWGEPGTNGQHAFYQLLHQGSEIVPVEFIGFQESQYRNDIEVQGTTSQEKLLANMLAQSVAFATGERAKNPNKNFAGNRPSSLIFARRLDVKTLGALLALYEAKIVFQGFCWNVNSFDQEGVQLGKILALSFLQEIEGKQTSPSALEHEVVKAVRF